MSELKETNQEPLNRRSFIMKILWALSALVGVIITIPVIGAILGPVIKKKPQSWRQVGNIEDFEIEKTVLVTFENASPHPWAGVTAQTASWLRRVSENEFVAFSVNCTHLGCPVRWMDDAELFLCPCHGGVYNKDGSRAAGPPPHGLTHYPVRLRNNKVEIQTSPLPITTL